MHLKLLAFFNVRHNNYYLQTLITSILWEIGFEKKFNSRHIWKNSHE